MTFAELVRLLETHGFRPLPEIPYSLVISVSEEGSVFRFHSPDLQGFSGEGASVEECLEKASSGMLAFAGRVPPPKKAPRVVIPNLRRGRRAG